MRFALGAPLIRPVQPVFPRACRPIAAVTRGVAVDKDSMEDARRSFADARKNSEGLSQDALVWARENGLLMKNGSGPGDVVNIPLAVLPTPFPSHHFSKIMGTSVGMHLLMYSVTKDEDFLFGALKGAAANDTFTGDLINLYQKVKNKKPGLEDEVSLGAFRADYMYDEPSNRMLQVEMNTMSVSFPALGCRVADLHRHIVKKCPSLDYEKVPKNNAESLIVDAFLKAHELVGIDDGAIAFVVLENETNTFDQQGLIDAIMEKSDIKVIKTTLKQLGSEAVLDESNQLRLGEDKISVVYYRSGYSPDHYPSDVEWRGRELAEISEAACCPTLLFHIAGAKKIQQELAKPGVLEELMADRPEYIPWIRQHFAGLWGLDDPSDPETAEVIKNALENPDDYVLKPQREGGGNNIYGEDIVKVLQKGESLAAYILMERIRPPVQSSTLLRNGEWSIEDTVSEFGVFGAWVMKNGHAYINQEVGHLVRTKVSSSDEGGVAAGYAVLDSTYLVD